MKTHSFQKSTIRQLFVRALLVLVALLYIAPQTVAALDPEQKLIFQTGIGYFDLSVCGTPTTEDTSNDKTGVSPGPVYIVGDSITDLAKSAYDTKFRNGGWDATVDGLVSRHITTSPPSPSGLDQIKKDSDTIAKTHAIVVALGTNDLENSAASVKSQVQKVMTALKSENKGNAPIFWVNVIDGTNDSDSKRTNDAIEDGVGDDADVIDWYSKAKSNADYKHFEEGVHPVKEADIDLLVKLVYDTVSGAAGATGGTTPSHDISGGVPFDAGMAIDDDGIGASHGDPYHQSHTSYADGKLDADTTNYIALAPGWAASHGLKLGDVAAVQYKGKTAYAVYGDNYKGDEVHGEGSLHLAIALGITDAAHPGTSRAQNSGVHYVAFPDTNKKLNGSVKQSKIDQIGAEASGGSAPSGADDSNDGPGDSSQACACNQEESSTTLTGNDNPEKIWNYFIGKGLSDAQTAGIMGNLQQESGFDPQAVEGGGRSKDPHDGNPGWGLIQWTPGEKVIGQAQTAGVNGPIYELSTQLDLVWEHMHNHPVVTANFDLDHFKSLTDPVEASKYFGSQIEGFGVEGARNTYAQDLFKKYSDSNGGSSSSSAGGEGSSSCGGASATSSPDCASASGSAKLICEAKKYDPVSYAMGSGHGGAANWHKDCTDIGPSCSLDCSGLVNLAVYDAFGVEVNQDTHAEASDTGHWKKISFSEIQSGDLIQPAAEAGEHVEIIDHVQGDKIFTFGAHSAHKPQPDQVGPSGYTKASGDLYLRWTGTGSR